MKQERQKLEDKLNLILQDYANDNKIINQVTDLLVENHNFSRGRTIGIFTQSMPISYFSNTELCLLVKYLYASTNEYKIKLNDWFNDNEIQSAETYKFINDEKTNRIVLHNVDQISSYQWICTKETYQNVALHMQNGLITYNINTQRQPMVRKYGDKITYTPNIKPSKVNAIKQEMVSGTFNPNTLIWNIRKVDGTEKEKFKYNSKDRTLTIEVDGINVDVIDGANRTGAILKAVEEKSNIDMTTLIMIYYVDEEKARQVIFQEAKAEPLDEKYVDQFDASNPNMEVAKSINGRQRMNEMFNRIGLDNQELRREERKLVTFETLSKTIEHVYDLKNQPIIKAQEVEEHLIKLFNTIIGLNNEEFKDKISTTKEETYMADNNMFIGYIVLGKELEDKFGDTWTRDLHVILDTLNFQKSNPIWKKNGIENNLNLSTIKKIAEYFKSLVNEKGVVSNVL